jgi:predicted RNase H-like HicB family nuclease
MRDAVAFHIDGLRREGLPVPEPSARYSVVEVPA